MGRLVLCGLLLLCLAGCSGTQSPRVTVVAAASLHEAFPAIAEAAGVEASFSFDGSSGVVDQLEGVARADVLATADRATMDRAVGLGLTDGQPQPFARNELALAVAGGNPLGIRGIGDAGGHKLVICAPALPCGRATRALAEDAGIRLSPVSEELSVTDAVGKVASGEADVAVVYATSTTDGVDLLPIDGAAAHATTLWIARLAGAPHPDSADAFVDAVLSEDGQALLADRDFKGAP